MIVVTMVIMVIMIMIMAIMMTVMIMINRLCQHDDHHVVNADVYE